MIHIPLAAQTAFLVFGPESSGNRFWMEKLLDCGCLGSSGIEQDWDTEFPTADRIAWRRSFPHGGVWTNIPRFVAKLWAHGYEVRAYVTMREWHSTAISQIKHKHVGTYEAAIENLQNAIPIITGALTDLEIPWLPVQYEALSSQVYVDTLLKAFDLKLFRESSCFENQNSKHY